MIKSYKIRLYPTKEQEASMWQHIGCCRYIWNYMLALQEERYKNGEKHLSAFDMMNLLKPLKNDGEHEWLYAVSNKSLQRICNDLHLAYEKFFKKQGGYPKFKSKKKAKTTYPISTDSFYFADERYVFIQKLGKVKYRTDFNLPIGRGHKFSNQRVSYKLGKWYLSFSIECENQVYDLNDYDMGIDLGVRILAAVAYGENRLVFHNINKSKKVRQIENRMKHLRRAISRKYEANRDGCIYHKTKNIERQEEKLRRMYARLSNIRTNYIHQTTHELVSLLPKRVTMENLNVRGMMKDRHRAKSISDERFYEFKRQMQYKCEWRGIEFVEADRFYPSSKTCSCCGYIKKDLKPSDSTYVCDECGLVIDRDYNAAVNLMRYAG